MQELNMLGKRKPTAVKTRLLMRLNGSTVDEANNPIVNVVGVSYLDNQKYGRKGAAFTRGGYVAVTKTPKLTFTSEFTVEFIATIPANLATNYEQMVFSNNAGWFFDFLNGFAAYNSGKPCWFVSFSTANDKSKSLAIDAPWLDGLPHHFAVCWKNGIYTVFLDGQPKGTVTSSVALVGDQLIVGNYYGSAAYGFTSNSLQEVRVSDFARYTAAFTPPVAPFVID